MRRHLPVVIAMALCSIATLVGAAPAARGSGTELHGIEKPTCFGRRATIVGTSGDDVIKGTRGDDVIVGLGGDDRLGGSRGYDRVCGGDGSDHVGSLIANGAFSGGSGRDVVEGWGIGRGGPGADRLTMAGKSNGGVGSDRMDGGDVQRGGRGNDVIRGGGTAINGVGGHLYGGKGDDHLTGEEGYWSSDAGGSDYLYGGPGDDHLHGSTETDEGATFEDTLDGGEHHDVCAGEGEFVSCEETP